jgi:preprotein translocase SecE subunit
MGSGGQAGRLPHRAKQEVLMALGIYKPGQGYWVRVLTATFAGVVILAAGAWLWDQLERTAQNLPKTAWTLNVSPASGAAAPGQRVALMGDPPKAGAAPAKVGAATVESSEATSSEGNRLTVREVSLSTGDVGTVKSVGPETGSAATLSGPVVGLPQGRALIEPLYLQGAGVGLLMLAGAIVTYWLIGANARTVEFLIATDGEMKKVNWSSRREVMGSTWVVILWSVLIAGGLFTVDLAFSGFFKFIGVLQR